MAATPDPCGLLAAVPEEQLHEWIVEQRWFASKSREIAQFSITESLCLRERVPALVVALVEARFATGTHETYQVVIGARPADEGWEERVIAEVDGWTLYDGLADPAAGQELLHQMRGGADIAGADGTLRFRWAEYADAGLAGTVDVRPVGVEQSNSSIVFGDQLIMKAFRRVEPGINPELELLRFLSARDFPHIAPLAGWYEYGGRLMDATLGTLQEYLAGAKDGWALCLDDPAGFVGRARDLGLVTGELHAALGSDSSDPDFAPEEMSVEQLALLTATVDEEIERLFVDLEDGDERVAEIAGRGQDVRERLGLLANIGVGGKVIRTHGDYHLGQTMLADRGWVILDFEGEPARSLPERRRKRSPLRDVAGMLRSFSYAASAGRIQRGVESPEGWEEQARAAFLEGYMESVDGSLLPPGSGGFDRLLAVFELEKVVYELRYELNNRPDWVGIPVAGIARLLASDL
jgi:trehalose synthase-fused probable maltokinase